MYVSIKYFVNELIIEKMNFIFIIGKLGFFGIFVCNKLVILIII